MAILTARVAVPAGAQCQNPLALSLDIDVNDRTVRAARAARAPDLR